MYIYILNSSSICNEIKLTILLRFIYGFVSLDEDGRPLALHHDGGGVIECIRPVFWGKTVTTQLERAWPASVPWNLKNGANLLRGVVHPTSIVLYSTKHTGLALERGWGIPPHSLKNTPQN